MPVPTQDPGTELVDRRSEYSQTYQEPDGTWHVYEYPDAQFYQAQGSSDWQPIVETFGAPSVQGASASVSQSPVQVSLFSADAANGFLRMDGGGHSVTFALPNGTQPGQPGTAASIQDNGGFAEYDDFLSGGVGLRVFPQSDGVKMFLVLPSHPTTTSFSFSVDSGDLALRLEADGSMTLRNAVGDVEGRIPPPFLLDSSDVEGRGGGLYSNAVTMSLANDGKTSTITLNIDPKFLDQAVYPVYVDPTVTTFPTGSTTANDTFASEHYPGTNFNTYQRPDSPYYHEMWHGEEPGTSYHNDVYLRFNDLLETLGSTHIDSASLQIYPYWQYYHYQDRPSEIDRVSQDWDAGTLKWNNKPATDLSYGEQNTHEGQWSNLDVAQYVQDVVNGTEPNYGLELEEDNVGQDDWKRIVSRNDSSGYKPVLVVTVTPFGNPTVYYPTGGGETSTRTVQWHDAAASTQSAYDVQLSTSSTFTSPIDSGTVTKSDQFYMVPNSIALTYGQLYYWRVEVKYGTSTTFTGWSDTGSFVYRQGATLGLPAFDTFQRFSLGTSDFASVNVVTGNLVISHPIVSLPIRGGAFGLGLTYNSESTTNTGTGPGWRLNAMRRLVEQTNGDVALTESDGSVATFAKVSTVGTVTTYTSPATVYATLVKDTSRTLEWTLTYQDQSVDSFDQFGSEGLLAKQADRFGNAVTFTYTSGTDRLYEATDPNGRIIDFGWNTSASPAQLTSITDWAYVSSGVVQSTSSGSRRQYRFFYDGSGNLIGWSDPIDTSGSCPTEASQRTCLTYGSNGLVATINKTQTYEVVSGSPAAITTSTQLATTTISYLGGEVADVQEPEQTAASETGTTFQRVMANEMQTVLTPQAYATTTYGFVATTDNLARVQSVWRDDGGPDIEQRTIWDSSYATEPSSITDNYGALESTPARTVSYTYGAGSVGPLVATMTEPLTSSTNRTTTYTYNANNDLTQTVESSGGSSTTTRYCYTTTGCATSGTALTMNSEIENYIDGTKGGTNGNDEDVETDYQYDTYGERTLETRWNYDASGTLFDSRAIGYTYDANGNETSEIDNYSDGVVSGTGDDVTPDTATGARTDLTTTFTYDTAGNQISSADPRRAIDLAESISLNADDYVSRTEYDALNEPTKETVARDPADTASPKYSTSAYDEFGDLRQSTDMGGVVNATAYDRDGNASNAYQDTDGSGSTPATTAGEQVNNTGDQETSGYDRIQATTDSSDATYEYDTLGNLTTEDDALSPPNTGAPPASKTADTIDVLGRTTQEIVGDEGTNPQTTTTTYDLGGRELTVDNGFTCTSYTYDYRDLVLAETTGLSTGCSGGTDQRTVTNTYDGRGRLTRSEVTSGTGTGDRTFDVTLDSAGNQLTSSVKTSGVTSTSTFTLNLLDQVMTEALPDGSTNKMNHDAAGNSTDRCHWQPGATVGSCYPVGTSGWTNPPTQVTTTSYDARDNAISFTDSSSGSTTTYDPSHNYQISAFYLPTGSGKEEQTLYSYDARQRVTGITMQLCTISSGHSCSSTVATGSDAYAYDDNDNRTEVNETNGATSSDQRYCYDALNRLQYRNTATGCSSSAKNESYMYDSSGNVTQTVIGSTTTTFTYNGAGQLCKVGGTTCSSPNVTYDSAGRITSYASGSTTWTYLYDSEGRLVTACKSTSCSGSIDEVVFTYDGQGHRTEIKEYTAGTLTTTRDFAYQGDTIVQESTNGTVSREYITDSSGAVVKFCDPNCTSPTTTYLVTWNGHGDAIGVWRVNSDGTLTLANSYTYSSWGTPTTTVASGFSDLGFRFLYVGAQGVQWDNFSGLGLYYMAARHYSPAIGRFLQPDPSRSDDNLFCYANDNPVSFEDSTGLAAKRVARVIQRQYVHSVIEQDITVELTLFDLVENGEMWAVMSVDAGGWPIVFWGWSGGWINLTRMAAGQFTPKSKWLWGDATKDNLTETVRTGAGFVIVDIGDLVVIGNAWYAISGVASGTIQGDAPIH